MLYADIDGDYLVSCDEKDVGVMASIMGKKNTVRKLKKVEAVEPSLLKYENKAFLAKDVLAAVNNNPDAKKLMVETASKIMQSCSGGKKLAAMKEVVKGENVPKDDAVLLLEAIMDVKSDQAKYDALSKKTAEQSANSGLLIEFVFSADYGCKSIDQVSPSVLANFCEAVAPICGKNDYLQNNKMQAVIKAEKELGLNVDGYELDGKKYAKYSWVEKNGSAVEYEEVGLKKPVINRLLSKLGGRGGK